MEKEEVFELVNNLIKSNKIYHSIIISNENQDLLDEVSIEITRQMFCESNSLINDNCKWCWKVINNNNLNIFSIGNGVDKITKNEIQELIIKFSLSAIEENKNKVYIIKNAEEMNEYAANSLLKFLEEPPNSTFAILLTKDKNQILSTIKSRCKIFNIFSESKNDEMEEKMINLILNKDKNNFLLYLIELKKKEKSEILKILEFTFKKSIILLDSRIQEILLDGIGEIKNSNYISLILENLFINIYEVL